MSEKEGFGGNLARFREKAGLTQAELSRRIGVQPQSVWRWEHGEREPSLEVLKKIADTLHVTEAELLNGPEKQEFEVKILMGVKNLAGMAGVEVADNSFLYGVQDDKPQIHLAGKVLIGTPEEREAALALIIQKFKQACWQFDHRDEAAAGAGA